MGHLDSHVIFDRALFARQSCAVGKRIPLRLQRASYRANNWVTTAQNWCRGSATEIGRKTAKTARDAKMFDATECREYVATVYRDILPGKFGWIAVHWIMLESAQNWSPNGTVGVSVTEQQRPKPMYHQGTILGQNLPSDKRIEYFLHAQNSAQRFNWKFWHSW